MGNSINCAAVRSNYPDREFGTKYILIILIICTNHQILSFLKNLTSKIQREQCLNNSLLLSQKEQLKQTELRNVRQMKE